MKIFNKKNINIIELILQVVFTIILFVAPIAQFSCKTDIKKYISGTSWYEVVGQNDCASGHIYFTNICEGEQIMPWLIFSFLIVCNILICILAVVYNNKFSRDSVLHSILPLAIFIIMLYLFNASGIRTSTRTVAHCFHDLSYTVCSTYYILAAIMTLIIVCSFAKRSKMLFSFKNILPKKESIPPKTDTTEELKKFKDLLDNGIITEEEFETKKKQLLDL